MPIVEPEVLMDGDHDIAACEDATGRALRALYSQMSDHRVDLAGTLLKVNMVVPGKGAATQADDATIAQATLRTLRAHVPEEVPGIVFLSGGMTDEEATSRLNEINRLGRRAVGDLVLLRSRAAAASAHGVARRRLQRRGGAGGARASRADERARARRRVVVGHGGIGRLTASGSDRREALGPGR